MHQNSSRRPLTDFINLLEQLKKLPFKLEQDEIDIELYILNAEKLQKEVYQVRKLEPS